MDHKRWEMKVEDSIECTFPQGLIEEVVDLMKAHHVFLFKGEMGVGKTSFIKELAKKIDVLDLVNSPTYSLVNEYHTTNGEKVFHFDLYRLVDEELFDIGFEEYLSDGAITFIEWPEIANEFYPENAIVVEIKVLNQIRVYDIYQQGHL